MTLEQNDLKVIAASARKIIGDIHEAAMGRRNLGTLHRDVSIEAMTILKLIEPHLDKVVQLHAQE
jgi:hypothetical protein